jgi:hypothetical protein
MPPLATLHLPIPLAPLLRTPLMPLWLLLLCTPLLWQGGALALLGATLVALSLVARRAPIPAWQDALPGHADTLK